MKRVELENVDVRTLRLLLLLLTEQSVSRAAIRMDLSQPAMSHALNRLRRIFNDPLLIRSPTGMVRTGRGDELVSATRDVLGRLEHLLTHEARFDPATTRRHFVLTSAPYTEFVLLPRVVRRIRREAPGLTLEVRAPAYGHAHETLERGEVDIRLAWGQGSTPQSLRSLPLFTDRIVCVLDRSVRERRRPPSLTHYLGAPHIRTQGVDRTTTGQVVDSAVARHGSTLIIAVQVQNYLTMPAMIVDTDLIATVPRRIAEALVTDTTLEIAPPPLRLPQLRMSAYWHERRQHDPAHRWLRQVIVEEAQRLPVAKPPT